MTEDDEDAGYHLSSDRFNKFLQEKIKASLRSLCTRNLSERDADFARGQIKGWEDALEAFNNKKKK